MRSALRSGRRLFALTFACWVMAVPLTSFARDAALCRHRAMHQDMSSRDSSGAPCWCSDMAGDATLFAAETPSLPADLILLPAAPLFTGPVALPLTGSPPASPTYAPTPPPPNAHLG
jgi:hypothetical protein